MRFMFTVQLMMSAGSQPLFSSPFRKHLIEMTACFLVSLRCHLCGVTFPLSVCTEKRQYLQHSSQFSI